MYELQNINKDIIAEYTKAIEQVEEKENTHEILKLALIDTFKSLVPELDDSVNKVFVTLFLQPLFHSKDKKKVIRDFLNEDEAKEIYHITYDKLIETMEENKDDASKYNLELIDYIYELLEYDKLLILNDKKMLYSYRNLSVFSSQHFTALSQLELLLKSKPAEKNIDIATNTNKSYRDKTKFLENIISDSLLNPYAKNRNTLELQKEFIKLFAEEFRMMARSIFAISKMQEGTDNSIANSIGDLEAYIDSDMEIIKEDIYMSWYVHVFEIYDHPKITLAKKLKLARLSSYVVFPELKNNKEFKVSEYTAKKSIRERAFFKGLRLLEFTDNRLKITKSDEEIELTSKYITTLTANINKYINDTTITTS